MPRNHHKNAEEKVLEDLKGFLKGNETLILGVSGGPDSVFLLHCLLKFRDQNITKQSKKNSTTKIPTNSLNIIVAHINHMLRGREAEKDMEFVEKLCKKNNLTFRSTAVDVDALSKTTKSSVEESGREIRYKFFEELFKEYKAQFCLTAHHSDDNLETIMLNLIRGASVKGLAGMKRFTTKKTSKLRIYRPLLCVSKEDIMAFLRKTNIDYRIDRTNLDTTIPRNFLRHKVIPLIKKLNPNITQTVLKNALTFDHLHEYIHIEAENWIKKHGSHNGTHHSTHDTKHSTPHTTHDKLHGKHDTANSAYHGSNHISHRAFPVKQFSPLPLALKKQIVLSIYQNLVGDTKNIENTHVEEVIEIIDRNVGGKKKRLGRYTVEIKQGRFIFNL